MNATYNSVFDSIFAYVKGQTMAAWIFLLSLVILFIGINGFAEDTYSSYVGIQMVEKAFNVRPASWEGTYWAMAISFQVITVIAFFAYLSNPQKHWWGLWVSFGAQIVDFIADVWYRSNGEFTSMVSVGVSLVMTFLFFTIGSEIALTFGLGLVAKLIVEGLSQLSIFTRNLFIGVGQMLQILASGKPGERGSTDSSMSKITKDLKFGDGEDKQKNKGIPVDMENIHIATERPRFAPTPPQSVRPVHGGNIPRPSFPVNNNNQSKKGNVR